MKVKCETDLYRRIHKELGAVAMIDCHEHLQRASQLPRGDNIHIGRFFVHYANCDLISSGMPAGDMAKVISDASLTPRDRWALLEPWYKKSWNTGYCESLRIAIRDLYGIEEFSSGTVDKLTEAMRKKIKPEFTREVFDKAGIDIAMNNPIDCKLVFDPGFDPECFICDMIDSFTGSFTAPGFLIAQLAGQANMDILCLDDYLKVIDVYFERDAKCAGAYKVGRAYDRTLRWEDAPKSAVENTFNRLLAFNDMPDRGDIKALEDFVLHYLCRKCGEYGIRMKFHTGIQEGVGNIVMNSRAALLANLFLKYPRTKFDIYHISYPYQEELVTIAKNFANVTVNFCWMWIINPAAGRRALSDMLDAIPANKIHGFGGDYIFVEGTYGHAVIARREIARVLSEKIEEGRFSEEYAVKIGRMILRDNAIENFGLEQRRKAFKERVSEQSTAGCA